MFKLSSCEIALNSRVAAGLGLTLSTWKEPSAKASNDRGCGVESLEPILVVKIKLYRVFISRKGGDMSSDRACFWEFHCKSLLGLIVLLSEWIPLFPIHWRAVSDWCSLYVPAQEFDPFKLTIDGDKLRGRGTTDCLGHVALITDLFRQLAERKPALKRTVVAVFIANEESSANLGVGVDALVKHGLLDNLKPGPL